MAVIDTPGRIMDDRTVETVQCEDVVVIPVRPTGGNLESFTRTVSLVKENTNCPIVIAVMVPTDLQHPYLSWNGCRNTDRKRLLILY